MAALRRKADLPLPANSTQASGFLRALWRGRGQDDSEMEKLGPQDVSEFTSDGGNLGQLAPRGHLLTAGPRPHVGRSESGPSAAGPGVLSLVSLVRNSDPPSPGALETQEY